MPRPSPRLLAIAALCVALSACATDQPPTALQPSAPASITIASTATPTIAPTPRFVTATPTPVVVPTLPGPLAGRVIAPNFVRLPETQIISDYGDPKVLAYITANWPHTHAVAPLCSRSETTRIPGVGSFITDDIGWMICGLFAMKGIQVKQLYKTEDGGVSWTLISETPTGGRGGRIPTTLPDGGTVGDLFFQDATHGWLSVDQQDGPSDYTAYSRSYLATTDDGGLSWRPVFVTKGQGRITHIAFKSPTDGLLAVLDPLTRLEVVLATQDGGTSWTQIYPEPVPNSTWQFIDARHAIGAGTVLNPAAILATEDGGGTWRQVGSLRNGQTDVVIQLSFPDPLHGWAVVENENPSGPPAATLFRTTDGGVTWLAVSPDGAQSPDIAYSGSLIDAQTGYAFTVTSQTWITHDGGETFQRTNDIDPRAPLASAIRAKAGRPMQAFQLYINDTWRSPGWVRIPVTNEINGFRIEDELHTRELVRGCDNRQFQHCQVLLFVSMDGAEWTRFDLGSVLPLRVEFEGSALRWMGRPAGPLYRTDDGGQNWIQIR